MIFFLVLLTAIIMTVIVLVIGGIMENTAHTIDSDDGWKHLSEGRIWKLFLYVLGLFISAALVVMGFMLELPEARGICGSVGFLLWITLSFLLAYQYSPLRPFTDRAPYILLRTLTAIFTCFIIIVAAWAIGLVILLKRTPRWIRIGLVAAMVLALILVGVLSVKETDSNIDKTETLKTAENYIASKEYEKAMDIYLSLDEKGLYLHAKYEYGLWYLEQGEYYKAKKIFVSLHEEENYLDSGELVLKVSYQRGIDCEEKGSFESAVKIYEDILEYRDVRQRYQRCCYLAGQEAAKLYYSTWDHTVEWFEKAGDYEDAPQLALYYQALMTGHDDLRAAEELLRQLPRDFKDVDTMLTAIETYGDWGGSYVLKKASGEDAEKFDAARLVLVYTQSSAINGPELEWKVVLIKGSKENAIDNDGKMPENDTLKFNYDLAGQYVYDFHVTKQTITLIYEETSNYGSGDVTTFEFVKE